MTIKRTLRLRDSIFLVGALVVLGTSLEYSRALTVAPTQESQVNEQGRHRRREFNDASLNDLYGFHTFALRVDPGNPVLGGSFPAAVSGYYRFNGDGTLHGKDTLSQGANFLIIDREYDGTYHVNSDGTGTLTLNFSPTVQPEGRFVITRSGDQIEIIFAVPGNVNAFSLFKQHTR
jgi:hypothetical protein